MRRGILSPGTQEVSGEREGYRASRHLTDRRQGELVREGLSNPQIVEAVGHDLTKQRLANLMSKHGIKRDPDKRWAHSGPKSR